MFAVLWYEMSYQNVLRRFGDFCIVVEAVLCTAQRLNINPCYYEDSFKQRSIEVTNSEGHQIEDLDEVTRCCIE